MKDLKDIINSIEVQYINGPAELGISDVTFDSRKVKPGAVFVAVPGTQTDGHLYINQAVESGAKAIIYEDPHYDKAYRITSVRVKNAAKALGIMASAFYDHPSSLLHLVGVTGTNGKTTTVTLLHRLFTSMGFKSGSFTTICNYIGEKTTGATHTTPDPVQLNRIMRMMVEEGCRYAFMEVSSHALVQHRIAGLTFAGGIFTNITHDHLDYHKTFGNYINAKKSFFDLLPENGFALINADDHNGKIMAQNTKASVEYYSVRSMARFKTRIIESHMDGMLLDIDQTQVWTKFIGEFNAYNLLAVYAGSLLLGLEKEQVLKGISLLDTVKGRFQHMRSDQGVTVIVDYAHTPDALQNVIKTIVVVRTGDTRLITVVGAGGDRDKSKRPVMAQIASKLSDMVILTSDNPRNEDPEQIVRDMKSGIDNQQIKKVITIIDRKEAITTACMLAKPGDIVLVAGKGHENYQEIKGVRHPFDDAEIVKELFATKNIKPA